MTIVRVMMTTTAMTIMTANGTSIEGAFYGSISRLILRGVKRRSPMARFGLELD